MENGVSLGRFRLDTDRRELSCEGQPVKLGSRALDILCVLAAAKGALVTKDALMAAVWPGVVVEENNIEVQISALRRCLGDHDAAQKCVVTIPGRGYRLVASAPPSVTNQNRSERATALPGTSIAVLPFQNMSG